MNPSSCGILGYRPTTSIVHSITSSDMRERLANLDNKSIVSLLCIYIYNIYVYIYIYIYIYLYIHIYNTYLVLKKYSSIRF